MAEEGVRLQKILSEAGIASRREAEKMIEDGEVTLNGKLAHLGDRAIMGKDHIKVGGKLLHKLPKKVVIAFFKPRGYMTTASPERKLEQSELPDVAQMAPSGTIWEFLDHVKERVVPVGRLDTDTEGLLLLTNDGELADRLNKAKYEVPRIYTVKIDGHLEEKKIKRLKNGVQVEDERIKAAEIEPGKTLGGKQWLRVTMNDPRNRLVRKMFEAVGHPVDKVRRDVFCDIGLKSLPRGAWRYLDLVEIERLRAYVGLGKGGITRESIEPAKPSKSLRKPAGPRRDAPRKRDKKSAETEGRGGARNRRRN